ncbi:MAG: alpha-amylase family glycosyl hydrolase [Puniceicoccaceae bacterium]
MSGVVPNLVESTIWVMIRGYAIIAIGLLTGCYLFASTAWIEPSDPVAGELATIHYDPSSGPLQHAGTVYIYRGFNNWAQVAGPDQPMTWDEAKQAYTFSYTLPEAAFVINCVFNNGSGTWDNNNTNDWHFNITPMAAPGEIPEGNPLPENGSGSGVMMQGFYWDVPEGTWYQTMASKAAQLRNMRDGEGIDRMWFPPPSKGQSGPHSMGYDPFDYYDLGQYHQMSTTRTRFGTHEQLKQAIQAYREQGIVCMADIVLNHRSGGAWEINPNTGSAYWTDFTGVASGMCTWNYDDFHPSSHELSDEGVFAGFPDVCHVTGNAPGDPYYDLIEWGNWLMDPTNAGFDGGWRLDFVKGVTPMMLRDFRSGTGNAFGILECWDGMPMIEAYVRASAGTAAFDFPGYYTLRDICNNSFGSGNIADLVNAERVYAAKDPSKAVTFVANHDTDEILRNKMLAYAFILTYEGYPCLFWRDYFDRGMSTVGGQSGNGIDPLVWIRGALGGGDPDIELLKGDSPDLLIYGTQDGSLEHPGYIVALNDHASSTLNANVQSNNVALFSKELTCYAWYSHASGKNIQPPDVSCDADGNVSVQAPPRGYAVYGPKNIAWSRISSVDSHSLNLKIAHAREAASYSIMTTPDPTDPEQWQEALEFSGDGNGQADIQLPIDGKSHIFARIKINDLSK